MPASRSRRGYKKQREVDKIKASLVLAICGIKGKLLITCYVMYKGFTVKRRRKMQMQKIKGTGYTLDKKQEHIYTFYGNMVYHYRLSDLKLLKSFKSLSYICRLALSNDEKHLAVTDMS